MISIGIVDPAAAKKERSSEVAAAQRLLAVEALWIYAEN